MVPSVAKPCAMPNFDRNRIVEYDHHAIASVTFERPAVFYDDFADRRMVVAQERHHVFSVRAFGKPGETAQVAEQRGNLASVTFQLLLRPRGNDQIGYLRRKEASQPTHAFDFAY
jgi:hypothetical protein